ncbi:Cytochrome b5 reductase 4 [Kappamyces sp. JEL0680]|nr:Cytochrome b5 reductase 4 [Kappamyces sp. JEL0680]
MRGGILFQPFQVSSVSCLLQAEADDEYSEVLEIVFALPHDGSLGFGQPGTHIKIRRPDSLVRARTYSLTSPAAQKGYFSVVVKVYRGGQMSQNYLGRLVAGDTMYVAKTLTKPTLDASKVGLVCFGIGITEMVLTAEELLRQGRQVILVHCLRYQREIIPVFEKKLQELLNRFPAAFRVYYVLSRETGLTGPNVYVGRLSGTIVQDIFKDWQPADKPRFLAIGTKKMMRETYALLSQSGFSLRLMGLPQLFVWNSFPLIYLSVVPLILSCYWAIKAKL